MTLTTAPTMTRAAPQIKFLLLALLVFFVNPRPLQVIGNLKSTRIVSAVSYHAVAQEQEDVLRGVYVEEILDLPVVQQPPDDPYYVSERAGEATQFSMASNYGSIGLLAHNTLAGRYFSGLVIGQDVQLTYSDGRVESFIVAEILRFQALEPQSVSSAFRNLDGNEILTATEMFKRAYVGDHRLVFQTCIEAQGNSSWGRLFVITMPKL